jgi:hypothetical protein
MRAKKAVAIVLLPVVLFLLALLIRAVEQELADGDATFYGGFVQLCFSSWPSKLSFDRHSWWFAVGVSSRIVLVFGSFAGIVAILESMIRQRRLPMKYAEVLTLRDNTIRDILASQLPIPDEQKREFATWFDNAVEAANKDVELQLRELFGRDSERILKSKTAAEQSTL